MCIDCEELIITYGDNINTNTGNSCDVCKKMFPYRELRLSQNGIICYGCRFGLKKPIHIMKIDLEDYLAIKAETEYAGLT